MKKKVKPILLILILILLILIINSTYSKYSSESIANIDRRIAQWKIKINDTDIVANPFLNTTFFITEDDLVWDTNSHIDDGKIAPGIKGHFYIRVDTTGCETSMNYSVSVDMNPVVENGINFVIKNIAEESGRTLTTINASNVSTFGRTKYNTENLIGQSVDRIRVDIEWVDDEDYNDKDTALGQTVDKVIQIPVIFNALQYTG